MTLSIKHVAFTATRGELTLRQASSLREVIIMLRPTHAHLGDCIGGDTRIHVLLRGLNMSVWADSPCKLIGHPPVPSNFRAFLTYDEERPPLPYLERNEAMVNESVILVAAPAQEQEILRSGTWATVRYARKVNVRRIIVRPDGSYM
jgi:hypothetical protein